MNTTARRPAAPLSHTAMVRRITRAFRAASAEHLAAGLGWYATAEQFCRTLDPRDVRRVAGVFAALSPRCQVSTNMAWCAAVIAAADQGLPCPAVHTTAMRAQAWRIANGEDPLSVLNGPKVRSFYRNITGDLDAVTVDVWATLVATGSKDERLIGTPSRYESVANAYRRAAEILGVSPREVQAATWMHARSIKPTDRAFHAAAAAASAAAA